jgi:hypothetical protein
VKYNKGVADCNIRADCWQYLRTPRGRRPVSWPRLRQALALPVMLMDIFNHSSFEITKRYLGITQDDRDRIYLGMELM